MTIQFYGSPMSSAGRTHLMLEECGVAYEYHRVNMRDPAQAEQFKQVSSNGKIPFLVDGDLKLFESVAINFYLAEKYAPQLWSTSVEDRARIYAWSLWSITNLQPESLRVMRHSAMLPPDQRDPREVEGGKKLAERYLGELEAQFPSSGFLVGGRYSVADVNVLSTVNLAAAIGLTVGPKTRAALDASKTRPAWQKVVSAG
jgi:glutathione S-transferase